MKRSYIDKADLAMPENVVFADIDFENESLHDGLHRYGVSMKEPSFFSWLGVTMYLKEDAIDAVLRSVAMFPAGSEIVLTFLTQSSGSPLPLAQRVANLSEPWVSYFEPDKLQVKLRNAGFSKVDFLSPAEAEARYFRQRPKDLPVPKQINILSAVR